ncbi:MAG: TVP38/TMEM64 family protein [Deltaproteobacteria bacterium]|nr:TVP38/TMEM64 family protein [Deltaproteobacteria bacterium]
MRSGSIKFLIFIIFILAAFISVRALGLEQYLDQDRLRGWIDNFGGWGPIVYILIYIMGTGLMLPGLPITVAGGILFGPLWGTVYVMIGATLGASLAFLIARYLGRDWVEAKMKGGRLKELDKKVEEQGWKIVAFTRLIPLFPFNILNYAFGLTNIKFSHYALATFIFIAPAVVPFVIFSSSILDVFKGKISKEFIVGLALVVIVSLIPFIYKKIKAGSK